MRAPEPWMIINPAGRPEDWRIRSQGNWVHTPKDRQQHTRRQHLRRNRDNDDARAIRPL